MIISFLSSFLFVLHGQFRQESIKFSPLFSMHIAAMKGFPCPKFQMLDCSPSLIKTLLYPFLPLCKISHSCPFVLHFHATFRPALHLFLLFHLLLIFLLKHIEPSTIFTYGDLTIAINLHILHFLKCLWFGLDFAQSKYYISISQFSFLFNR